MGGNQEQEFIRLHNQENTEIDLSGWSLDGGVKFTFRAGTVIERNGDLYLTPNSKEFLQRTTSPTAGEEHLTAGPYSGKLSNFSEILNLRDQNGELVHSFNTPNTPSDAQLYLVISEIMYHPSSPHGDAEYLEFLNTSDTVTLDLAGLSLTNGVDFTFPPGITLPPGGRILVVLDQSAFEAVHGLGLPIAGVFQNNTRLSNSGERIKLEDASNSTIQEFTYGDKSPWPVGADGQGFSLVFIDPLSSPDHNEALNWRESFFLGGTPGRSEEIPFTGDPEADPDRDGLSNLLEYAFGTSPSAPNANPFQVGLTGNILEISTTLSQTATGIETTVQSSPDLVTWTTAADLSEVSRISNGDGTASVTYQSTEEFLSNKAQKFYRLKVTLLL